MRYPYATNLKRSEAIAFSDWCAANGISEADRDRIASYHIAGMHGIEAIYPRADGIWQVGIRGPNGGYDRVAVPDFLAGQRKEQE